MHSPPASHSLRHLCTAQGFLGQASQAASQAEKTEIRLSIKRMWKIHLQNHFQESKKRKNKRMIYYLSQSLTPWQGTMS